MRLTLLRTHVYEVVEDAKNRKPHEACGLILGKNGISSEVIVVENVATDPTISVHFDEQRQINEMMHAHRKNLDITAINLSHPNTEVIPSETDIREASDRDIPYLIVGLKQSKPNLQA